MAECRLARRHWSLDWRWASASTAAFKDNDNKKQNDGKDMSSEQGEGRQLFHGSFPMQMLREMFAKSGC